MVTLTEADKRVTGARTRGMGIPFIGMQLKGGKMAVRRDLAHGAAVDTVVHGQKRVSVADEGVVTGKRGQRQDIAVRWALSVCRVSERGGEALRRWPMETRAGANRCVQ
jgi:hypothetical protein